MQKRFISIRSWVAYGHDIIMAGVSFFAALYLRVGSDIYLHVPPETLYPTAALFVALAAFFYWLMGLYRGIWRYASVNDLMNITRTVSVIVLAFVAIMFLWTRLEGLPRSLPFINWFVLMALLGGPRFIYRIAKDRRFDFRLENPAMPRIPVLLAGAGDGAEQFIRALSRPGGDQYRAVGIIAETPGRVGRNIHGVEVMATFDQIDSVIESFSEHGEQPQRLIITRDDMDGTLVRSLLEGAGRHGMTLARLPRMTDLKSGVEDRLEIRPVDVEDLLGRPQQPLDRKSMQTLIQGRRVLVTGAGGSIGSELSRQIAGLGPSEIALLDNSEFNLYTIDMELSNLAPDTPHQAILADVRDRQRIDRVFADFRPELVFHAAALKHVPMVEDNVAEGVMTNIIGSANVIETCRAHNVAVMVQVSTDKAVNPTNIMGATKRIAESYAQALDVAQSQAGEGATRFVTVRFGNVLGSTGSVVPLFQNQLAAGGPLTVTHPDMTRYFMTVREAVELILQASALGMRSEASTGLAGEATSDRSGKIYVLDMGEPVRILDLAHQMIRLAGLVPDRDIAIDFVGIRPGEKLFEEIFHGKEPLVATEHPGILLAAPRSGDEKFLRSAIDGLHGACMRGDRDGLIESIRTLVPEYAPPGEGD